MRGDLPAPPEHPRLDPARVALLARHLTDELRHQHDRAWRRPRRRVALLAAAALATTIVGASYALATGALDAFDFRGGREDPQRIGARVEVTSVDGFALYAWKSTRGICLGVAERGEPLGSGCGMPVIGAPPDEVFRQPEPTHVIGYMAGGGAGDAFWVTGPVAENVDRVEVELVNGRVLRGHVREAPAALQANVDFYFILDEASRKTTFGPDRHPVRSLRAYNAGGALLERLAVPGP